jgi:hypothetical protein
MSAQKPRELPNEPPLPDDALVPFEQGRRLSYLVLVTLVEVAWLAAVGYVAYRLLAWV